jgi:tRNA dimethylallyltransferase
MTNQPKNLLVVLGPTASGKTHLAVQLANRLAGEIISADSRQVYRGLDIGSGKDLQEYSAGEKSIPYHLIDHVSLDQEFSVYHFQKEFYKIFKACQARQVLPLLVGGTGLYLDATLFGYPMQQVPENPELRAELAGFSREVLVRRLSTLKQQHNTTDVLDSQRLIRAIEIAEYEVQHTPEVPPVISALVLGVKWDREVLRQRIARRLQERMQQGLIAEVENLRRLGISWERLQSLGLEYRWVSDYLLGTISSPEEVQEQLYLAICKYAKRQETWFRRMERRGIEIHWIEQADIEVAWEIVTSVFKK